MAAGSCSLLSPQQTLSIARDEYSECIGWAWLNLKFLAGILMLEPAVAVAVAVKVSM